jgi:hypothetical protein
MRRCGRVDLGAVMVQQKEIGVDGKVAPDIHPDAAAFPNSPQRRKHVVIFNVL